MNFLQTIKAKSKAVIGLILTGAVMLSLFASAMPAQAASPRFNFLQGDWELMRGANRTTNQADWSDPVSGNAGDTFAGIVYYHNGTIDTTAQNVRIKVSIPSETSNKTAVLSASISADNAATVTETVIDGRLEGKSGLTVNLNEDAKLSLVPGSVKWFPNFVNPTVPNQALPFGQSGDEILSSNGLRIGNIQGCWPFLGYVTFLFKSAKSALPQVNVDKTVRNVTIGENSFVKSNFAKPGDTLEYRIIVNNGGAGTANNLYLVDTIPANTTFVAGSATLSRNGGATGQLGDALVGEGVSIGNYATGETAEVRFRVRVSQGVANGETLTNTAFLHFDKEVLPSTATTVVKFGIVTPPGEPTLPVTGADGLTISLLIALLGGLAGIYWKYRKALKIALK